MNCANVVYLFGVLCVLASPSLTAPAQQIGSPEVVPEESKNEVDSKFDSKYDNVETFDTVDNQKGAPSVGATTSPDASKTPQIVGGGSGIIQKWGSDSSDGTCMY